MVDAAVAGTAANVAAVATAAAKVVVGSEAKVVVAMAMALAVAVMVAAARRTAGVRRARKKQFSVARDGRSLNIFGRTQAAAIAQRDLPEEAVAKAGRSRSNWRRPRPARGTERGRARESPTLCWRP